VSRFIPSLDDITAGRVRPETHVGFEQTANIDLAGLEVPTLEDEGELCDEVSALMTAMNVQMGPTRVDNGQVIRGLWLEVPLHRAARDASCPLLAAA